MGSGALLIGSGVVTAIISSSAKRKLDRECTLPASQPGRVGCPLSLEDTRDRVHSYAIATDVLWLAGLASAGVGVTLWLTARGASTESSTTASVGCQGGACGAQLHGRF